MSSISPDPNSKLPTIESLAPPLPGTSAFAVGCTAESPVQPSPDIQVNETWVPVEIQPDQVRTAAPSKEVASEHESANLPDDLARQETSVNASWPEGVRRLNGVRKPNGTAAPQESRQSGSAIASVAGQRVGGVRSSQIQKDNTLAIFVTLCALVVAIACGIYIVAERESAVQMKSESPNPLFGKPISGTVSKLPGSISPGIIRKVGLQHARVHCSAQDRTNAVIQESQRQLALLHYIEAEYLARQSVKLSPNLPESWLALGKALYRQGRYYEAGTALVDCLRHGPGSKTAAAARLMLSKLSA